MSKREVLTRYNVIINKLKKFPATLKQINEELERASENLDYNLRISSRTFLRDLEDIRSLYKINIQYNFTKKTYGILEQDEEEISDRMLEALGIFNALNSSIGFSNYIDFEKRKSTGFDNFYGLLHAIKNKHQINFTYQNYWSEITSDKKVEPYLLKEFRNRWYLIAKDLEKNELRTYGLDRILDMDLSKKKFTYPAKFIPKEYFRNSFGIIGNSDNLSLQTVILSFDEHQGKYIKSLPLHASQLILSDNKTELLIELKLYITFDFEMELLSYGSRVKVVKPNSLIVSIKNKLEDALSYYK